MLAAQLSIVDWFLSSVIVAVGLGAVPSALRRSGARLLG
jgi:hypothetical protein